VGDFVGSPRGDWVGVGRTSIDSPFSPGAVGQANGLNEASRCGGAGDCVSCARVIARVADISTTVVPGSRNGDPIVACSPQLIGRSNASRLSSSLSTYTTFSPSTMRMVRRNISWTIGSVAENDTVVVEPFVLSEETFSHITRCASPWPGKPAVRS